MSESKLQQTCVKWWAYAAHAKGIDRRFLVAIPNGGKRDARTGALMKKEGASNDYVELPLGQGGVVFEYYLRALDEIGYTGYLTIEREQGEDRVGDIQRAIQFLRGFD